MAEESGGPVLPKMLLAEALKRMRQEADMKLSDVAKIVPRKLPTLSRYESGEILPDLLVLKALCEAYNRPDKYEDLRTIHEGASRKGWWITTGGPRPQTQSALLGMEEAATRMRSFDCFVPGLLQTPAYARAVIRAIDHDITRENLDKGIKLRMERQQRAFDDPKREFVFVIDESALARMPGAAATRRSQLGRLVNPPNNATILLLPFEAGPHPALAGFTLFDFPATSISKGIYVEPALSIEAIVEAGAEVESYERIWERLRAMSLGVRPSRQYIQRMMEGISDE